MLWTRSGRLAVGLAFCLLATLSQGARAQDSDAIRDGVAAAIAALFADSGPIAYDSIDVEGAASPYAVTVHGIKLGSGDWDTLAIDTVRFKVTPAADGLYAVSDLEIPSPLLRGTPDGNALALQHGDDSFNAVWSPALKAFVSLDAELSDVVMQAGGGSGSLSLRRLGLHGQRHEVAPGRWDQELAVSIRGLHAIDSSVHVAVGEVEACLRSPALDLAAVWLLLGAGTGEPPAAPSTGAAEPTGTEVQRHGPLNTRPEEAAPVEPVEPAAPSTTPTSGSQGAALTGPVPTCDTPPAATADAGGSEPAGLEQAVHQLPAVVGDLVVNLALHDVFAHADGQIVTFDDDRIDLALSGFGGDRAVLRLVAHESGLKGMHAPEATVGIGAVQQLMVMRALLPDEVHLDLRIADLPVVSIWRSLLDRIDAAPEDDMLQTVMQTVLPLLGAAGSTLQLDSKVTSRIAELDTTGQVQASAAAALGGTGTATIELTGFDRIIDLAKATGATRSDLMPMDLLRALAARTTAADGATVDRYALSLGSDGVPRLNDKPFLSLFSALGK